VSQEETIEVVQTVVRTRGEEKYLIGKRSKDDYWEFLGGKVEEGENLEEAAIRELNEETGLELSEEDILEFREGESYRSSDDRKFRLNPVLIEVKDSKIGEAGKDLSEEHLEAEWIDLENFYDYESLGQYPALENLGITEGDVALAVPEKSGKLFAVKRSEQTSSSGLWNFPGGKVEEDESLEEAALRELEEETGMTGEVDESGEPYINDGELGYWRIFPFLVEVSGEVELNHEHTEHRWIRPEEIRELETLCTFRAMKELELIEDG
jgi:8-oxo-dGTP diphosphatase